MDQPLIQVSRADYERLLASEALFRAIAESAPVMVWVADAEGLCTWFNRRWLDFTGLSMAQGIGNGWADGVHPEDIERVHHDYGTAFEARLACRLQYRLRRHDGEYRWIMDQGEPRYSASGEFLGYIGCSIDITEIEDARRAEREASKRLAELAAIVEFSDDVILSKDLNGVVTSWNTAASRVFGYSAAEMIGSSILTLIPEDLHPDETRILESIRAGRPIEHFETVRRSKNGQLIDVSISVSPVKDSQGKVIGASKILRDISARKRLEQSLLQAEKIAAMGRMAATIAHEINNPLEAIVNLLYLARTQSRDPQVIEYLETAEGELARVSHIARQTVGLYKEHTSTTCASLAEIAEQAARIYAPRSRAAGIELVLRIESTRCVTMRRGEMMQVVSNLITNALYAMPAGGVLTITIEDSPSPDGLLLQVTDTGVGIEPSVLPRVFDAFFTTRSTIGIGIGLFVARQFVEGHGGTISLESRTSGEERGTSVRVFLPARTLYDETGQAGRNPAAHA